jgi:bifunctional DNase/RNase
MLDDRLDAAPTDHDLVAVSVIDVAVAVPAGNGVEAGMVVLQEIAPPCRRLRIYVGQPEARAIRVAWRGETPPRPSTWDLFVSTVSLLGGRFTRAVVDRVEEGRHFFGRIDLLHGGEPLELPARPSDAIALALRSPGSGLFARRAVLDAAGVDPDGRPVAPPGPSAVLPTDPHDAARALIDQVRAGGSDLAVPGITGQDQPPGPVIGAAAHSDQAAAPGGPVPTGGDAVDDPHEAARALIDQVLSERSRPQGQETIEPPAQGG